MDIGPHIKIVSAPNSGLGFDADSALGNGPCRESGFSLLETLVALAIMSIASLALFQSTSAMLSLSDRAVKTSERVLDAELSRRAVTGLLSALMPAWPEDQARQFSGSATTLQGLSTKGLSWQSEALGSGLAHFALSLKDSANGGAVLEYTDLSQRSSGASAQAQGWILEASLPAGARFTYQGLDGQWYSQWPPANPPATPYFDDALFIQTPALPEAIRLQASNGAVLSLAAVRAQSTLPARIDLGRDNVP